MAFSQPGRSATVQGPIPALETNKAGKLGSDGEPLPGLGWKRNDQNDEISGVGSNSAPDEDFPETAPVRLDCPSPGADLNRLSPVAWCR